MSGKGKTNLKRMLPKIKDMPRQSSSRQKSSDSSPEPLKEQCPLSFPLLKTVENSRALPRYSIILGRTEEEGVGMEDLDALQLELETLLSGTVVRTRVLNEEIRVLSNEEEKRDHFKRSSKPVGRPSLKRCKNQDKASKKFREAQKSDPASQGKTPQPIKFTKVKTVSLVSNPLNNLSILEQDSFDTRLEGRKVIAPKNDTPNKFWASVDPYCTDITEDDIQLLHDLISKQENLGEYYKIPPLGKHYTLRWATEDLEDEASASSQGRPKRSGDASMGLRKGQEKYNEASGTVSGPLMQRLVSGLMEENVSGLEDKKKLEKIGAGHENALPNIPNVCRSYSLNFERRVRKQLEDCGILDPPEATKEEDDEILAEIKRCQAELKVVANHNIQQLQRVLGASEVQLERQELTSRLSATDAEICDLYRRIQTAKIKKKPPNKKDQDQAMQALRDREMLIQQIDSLGDRAW